MTPKKTFSAFLLVVFAISMVGAGSGEKGSDSKNATYSETEDGLKSLIEDCLASFKPGKKKERTRLFDSLIIPNHDDWFRKKFGDERGALGAAEYTETIPVLKMALPQLFKETVQKKMSEITVLKFDAENDDAKYAQNELFKHMKEPVALYTVVMIKPGTEDVTDFWSFVYVDGSFRYADKMGAVFK